MVLVQVPESHRHGQLMLVPKTWARTLLRERQVPHILPPTSPPLSAADATAWLRQQRVPDGGDQWALLRAQVYSRHPKAKAMLALDSICQQEGKTSLWSWGQQPPPTFQEVLADVWTTNQAATRQNSLSHWASKGNQQAKDLCGDTVNVKVKSYDQLLLTTLLKLYGTDTPLIDATTKEEHQLTTSPPPLGENPSRVNLVGGVLAIVVEDARLVLLRSHRRRKFTLRSALTLSPAFFGLPESPTRTLFVAHQLVRAFDAAHKVGLWIRNESNST